MPFTPAHAVVALPFARSRRWSSSAVACGAVAPDLPLLLTGGRGYDLTHSVAGVPTVDVLLGLGCLALWVALLRPGVVAVLPRRVRARSRPARRHPVELVPVAVLAGAASHVVWDAFTHAGRLGSQLLPVLQQRLGPFALTSWAQYASGALGLLALALAAVLALRRSTADAASGESALGIAAAPAGVAALVVPVLVTAAAAVVRVRSAGAGGSVQGAAVAAAVLLLPLLAGAFAAVGFFARIAGVRGRRGRRTPERRG